jgi:S-formylglutathione hydrolase FrmB
MDAIDIPGLTIMPRPPMKTVYLLHGFQGIGSDWAYGTRIQELSMRYNFAIILPSGENSFYLDDVEKGELFGEFVGRELVDFSRSLFGLSASREDTFIGGYSMGGYGALRNGLKYNDTFGGIIALSSALIVKTISQIQPGYANPIANYDYYHRVFGEPTKLPGSDKDPEALVESIRKTGVRMPRLYMACGSEDFLIAENREFHEYLKKERIEHRYEEGAGAHNFKFWDEYIEKALVWIREN